MQLYDVSRQNLHSTEVIDDVDKKMIVYFKTCLLRSKFIISLNILIILQVHY